MKQDSKFVVIMKSIWPPIYKVLNVVVYFLITLIRNFFRTAMQMIKGG